MKPEVLEYPRVLLSTTLRLSGQLDDHLKQVCLFVAVIVLHRIL